MDPAANLREQESLAKRIEELTGKANDLELTPFEQIELTESAACLAELVLAYCEWIKKGGSPR